MQNNNWTVEQVIDFFDQHWTVRKYKNFDMPQEHLNAILQAAQRAPTDATAQLYSIIRLKDKALRKNVATAAKNPHIESASEAFLICADINRTKKILKTHGYKAGHYPDVAKHFCIGDAVMAGQNMLMAAEMLGYRGCWIGGVLNDIDKISEMVQLPDGVFIFAALTLGLADEPAQKRPRLPRNQVVHEDSYRPLTEQELKKAAEDMKPISPLNSWPELLARYFAENGGFEKRESLLKAYLNKQKF